LDQHFSSERKLVKIYKICLLCTIPIEAMLLIYPIYFLATDYHKYGDGKTQHWILGSFNSLLLLRSVIIGAIFFTTMVRLRRAI